VSINRFAARNDKNHSEIVQALLKAGVWVFVQKRPTDLLCIHKVSHKPLFLEIKSNSKSRLTPIQAEFASLVAMDHFYRVETVEQALSAVGAM